MTLSDLFSPNYSRKKPDSNSLCSYCTALHMTATTCTTAAVQTTHT